MDNSIIALRRNSMQYMYAEHISSIHEPNASTSRGSGSSPVTRGRHELVQRQQRDRVSEAFAERWRKRSRSTRFSRSAWTRPCCALAVGCPPPVRRTIVVALRGSRTWRVRSTRWGGRYVRIVGPTNQRVAGITCVFHHEITANDCTCACTDTTNEHVHVPRP